MKLLGLPRFTDSFFLNLIGLKERLRIVLRAFITADSFVTLFFQVSLDGIRMLDPNTNRTLRIYSLENITRCDVSLLISFVKLRFVYEINLFS